MTDRQDPDCTRDCVTQEYFLKCVEHFEKVVVSLSFTGYLLSGVFFNALVQK